MGHTGVKTNFPNSMLIINVTLHPEHIFAVLGDTAFNLAEATLGGRVVAFEMGPPIQFLHFNKKQVTRHQTTSIYL